MANRSVSMAEPGQNQAPRRLASLTQLILFYNFSRMNEQELSSSESQSTEEEQGMKNTPGQLKTRLSCIDGIRGVAKIQQLLGLQGGIRMKATLLLNSGTPSSAGASSAGVLTFCSKLDRPIPFNSRPSSLQRVLQASVEQRSGRLLSDPSIIDPIGKFLPLGVQSLIFDDWQISPTLTLSNASLGQNQLTCGIKLLKGPGVIRLVEGFHTLLSGKAHLQNNPKSRDTDFTASIRLKRFWSHVTSTQDLRLVLGIDAVASNVSIPRGRIYPFLKMEENNLSIKFQKDQLSISYDL